MGVLIANPATVEVGIVIAVTAVTIQTVHDAREEMRPNTQKAMLGALKKIGESHSRWDTEPFVDRLGLRPELDVINRAVEDWGGWTVRFQPPSPNQGRGWEERLRIRMQAPRTQQTLDRITRAILENGGFSADAINAMLEDRL